MPYDPWCSRPSSTSAPGVSDNVKRLASQESVFRSVPEPCHEGTSLASLDLDVVRVAGVTQYTSVAGARVQAFRIEPAW